VPTGLDTMSSRQKLLVGVMTAAPLWLLVHMLWRLGFDRFAVSTAQIAVSGAVLLASLAAAVALVREGGHTGSTLPAVVHLAAGAIATAVAGGLLMFAALVAAVAVGS
jgi:hypothetical protein